MNASDVPRSLQSWVSTVQTVVLTADVFQLVIKYIFCVWLVFVLASIITYQVFESLRYRNNVTFYPLPSLDSSIPIHATRATSDSSYILLRAFFFWSCRLSCLFFPKFYENELSWCFALSVKFHSLWQNASSVSSYNFRRFTNLEKIISSEKCFFRASWWNLPSK